MYDKMGQLSKTLELPWTPDTPPADGKPKESGGAVVAIDFSHDSSQRLMYVINQNNGVIEVVERETGKIFPASAASATFRVNSISLTASRSIPRQRLCGGESGQTNSEVQDGREIT